MGHALKKQSVFLRGLPTASTLPPVTQKPNAKNKARLPPPASGFWAHGKVCMLIGYVRVSKSDGSQVLDLQRDALVEVGVEPCRVYEDLASWHKDDRPGLASCVKALQPGNTLVVWSLDRLGRDLKHLVGLIDTLNQQQVGLKVLAGTGAQIDTTTANGRLVFGIFAALAEFEAALIRGTRSQGGVHRVSCQVTLFF